MIVCEDDGCPAESAHAPFPVFVFFPDEYFIKTQLHWLDKQKSIHDDLSATAYYSPSLILSETFNQRVTEWSNQYFSSVAHHGSFECTIYRTVKCGCDGVCGVKLSCEFSVMHISESHDCDNI